MQQDVLLSVSYTHLKGDKNMSFLVDDVMPFKICPEGMKIKNNPGVTYALHKAEIGRGNQIPLWMFGFLY